MSERVPNERGAFLVEALAGAPLVSIVIPTYDCRRWLGEAIDSALTQTYPHCEIIVVDDGSTDGTGQWVQAYYGDRIRYFWQEHAGVARARNLGLVEAKGEYIQFLDADDLLLPNKIAEHVRFLDSHPNYGVVYCEQLCFRNDNPADTFEWVYKKRFQSGKILLALIDSGLFCPLAALIRRSVIDRVGQFDETLASNEDWDFFLRLAHAGVEFYYLPGKPLALYRAHGAMRSGKALLHTQSGVQALKKLESAIADPEACHRLGLEASIGRWQYFYGRALVHNGRRWQGIRKVLQSLTLNREHLDQRLAYLLLAAVTDPTTTDSIMRRLGRLKHQVIRFATRGNGNHTTS